MTRLLVLLAAVAALVPLWPRATPAAPAPVAWPTRWEGRALTPLPPAPADRRLAAGFPGRVARFADGERQVVLRHMTAATRRLHPARDCFEGIGYRIAPARMRRTGGAYSSCFLASRDGVTIRVCERIVAADGGSFPDVSSWYWPALIGRSRGPWIAALVAQRVPS